MSEPKMRADDLKALMDGGQFHHATYRDIGTVWEGWHIYVKSETGFRGFTHYTCFGKNHPDIEAVYQLLRGTGYSVGSYGNG